MHFRQFYLGCLAHASYLIGSDGEAAVVDPQRDVGIYLEEAREHGLQIKHVIGEFRSSIGTSILERLGFDRISNVVGGMGAWNNTKPAAP